MKDNTKNFIITIGFCFIIILVFFVNVLTKDKEISITERRKLTAFPGISISKLLKGETTGKFEDYAVDQFVGRDTFRTIKASFSTKIYNQKDNNKLFEKDGAIYKMEYPLEENKVQKSAKKLKDVYEKYLKGMNVYYSIIPDKNYYLENDDHLKIDYNKVQKIVQNELTDLKYIDIREGLELIDYYKTDLHWKQENLQDVVKIIQTNMELEEKNISYQIENKGDFYGAYYGQLATNVNPDKLNILTNEAIENCSTYNFETQKNSTIYTENNSADRYDIFISGATSLISIENPIANTDKELLLFRDSFGSSLAPLLVENYKKITLIDLRYISSKLLSNYIDFKDQDVLLIYSTTVLNQNIFKNY